VALAQATLEGAGAREGVVEISRGLGELPGRRFGSVALQRARDGASRQPPSDRRRLARRDVQRFEPRVGQFANRDGLANQAGNRAECGHWGVLDGGGAAQLFGFEPADSVRLCGELRPRRLRP
jgi:hypothetical protein